MNDSSKDKDRQSSDRLGTSTSVTDYHDEMIFCDDSGAEGNETDSNDGLVRLVGYHRDDEHDLPGSRRTNSSAIEASVDQEHCASSSSFQVPRSPQNFSTLSRFIPGNFAFLEARHKQTHDPFVRENGLMEMGNRMVLPTNDCGSTTGANGFYQRSGDAVPLSTCSRNETTGHNIIGDQIDAGYMEEADAYMESNDNVAVNLVSEKGAGVHLSFGMDVGAAGGVGSIDDIGDFIDADIPLYRNSSSQFSSRSNDSMASSLEELTSCALVCEKAETEKVGSSFPRVRSSVHASVGIAEEVRKRLMEPSVNSLSLAAGRVQGPRNDLTGDFGAVLRQPQSSGLSQSSCSSFDKEPTHEREKCWRWSDGDGVSGLFPSLTAANSLASSDFSYGTPSVPLMSPISMEDEVVASAISSPECLSHLPLKVDKCSHGSGCLVNSDSLNHNRWRREEFFAAKPVSELCCSCRSCNNLLENMNQTTSKRALEKFFAWEMAANSDRPSTVLSTKRLQNDAAVNGHGSQHPLVLSPSRVSCVQCNSDSQRMSTSFNGTGISNSEIIASPNREMFGAFSSEKSLHSAASDESFPLPKNRRFSYQNPTGSDLSDFHSSPHVDGCSWNAQSRITSTLSENSLHSTQLLKSRPFSLLLDSQRTGNCLDGNCRGFRNGNASHHEMGQLCVGSKSSQKKKISACAHQSMSLSEEEREEDVADEEINSRAHRRNKNGHHCRYGNEMRGFSCDLPMCDTNLPRPENCTLKSGFMIACCVCPVNGLLRLLGVNDVGRPVCDLFPTANDFIKEASLPEYLLSCSTAGVTAEQLLSRVAVLTKDLIYGKFFPLYPQRNIHLIPWLKYWIRKGAVPLATVKCEHHDGAGDSWQHKLLHSAWDPGLVDASLSEDTVPARWFCSNSSLRISRHNVVSRWQEDCDLNTLVTHTDTRWHQMNVLGQVVNILREERLATAVGAYRPQLTSHIVIPTHYKSGITLYLRTDSTGFAELESTTSDLPSAEQISESESVKRVAAPQDRSRSRAHGCSTRIKETMIF